MAQNHEPQSLNLSEELTIKSGWTYEQALDPDLRASWHDHLYELYAAADRGDKLAGHQIKLYKIRGYGRTDDYINLNIVEEDALVRGNPDALFSLGTAKMLGLHGLEKKPEEGLSLILRACEMNHPDSLVEMGRLHMVGQIVPLDYDKALDYFKRAEKHGSSWALIKQGDALRAKGRYEEAIAIYKREGEKGRALGSMKAAVTCLNQGIYRDQIIPLAEQSALNGSPFAHELLARLYLGDHQVVKQVDPERAMKHMEMLMRTGSKDLWRQMASFLGISGSSDRLIQPDGSEGDPDIHGTNRRLTLLSSDHERATKILSKLKNFVGSAAK